MALIWAMLFSHEIHTDPNPPNTQYTSFKGNHTNILWCFIAPSIILMLFEWDLSGTNVKGSNKRTMKVNQYKNESSTMVLIPSKISN